MNEQDVKRVFGGEWEGEEPPAPEQVTEVDIKGGSQAAWDRFVSVDSESRRTILIRARRLRTEGWEIAKAVDLACGLLPEDLVKWPPNQRYRVAKGIPESTVRKEVEDWFWRNHCIDHDDAVNLLEA